MAASMAVFGSAPAPASSRPARVDARAQGESPLTSPPAAHPPSLAQRIVVASVGAVITGLFTTPLDVVKTRLQTNLPLASSRRASALSTLSSVATQEGVAALWRGLVPSMLMAIPSTVLYFAFYEEVKHVIQVNTRQEGVAHQSAPFSAGILGRIMAVSIVSPLELVRTRAMAARASRHASIRHIVAGELAGGTWRTLWRGLAPTLWRDVPFSGLYWFTYERMKSSLTRALSVPRATSAATVAAGTSVPAQSGSAGAAAPVSGVAPPSWLATGVIAFASGVTAGALASVVTTPFDVIKTRRQVWTSGHVAQSSATQDASMPTLHMLRSIAAREGLPGLFAGMTARVAKVAPSCAIMISSYELGKYLFARYAAASELEAVAATAEGGRQAGSLSPALTLRDQEVAGTELSDMPLDYALPISDE